MKKYLFTAVILFFITVSGFSQETVTIDSLIGVVKQNNAELLSARAKWNASKEMAVQQRTWDNPKLALEWWTIPDGALSLSDATEKMYGISQMIPFPGKLYNKGRAAASQAEVVKWEYKNTELKVLSELKSAYSRYWYINKAIQTYLEIAGLMNNFSKVAQSRYIAGKASQTEVLRAQVESEKMSNMTITLEQEKQTMQAEINRLLGKNADDKLGEPQEMALNYLNKTWNEIKSLAISNNPEIGKSKADVIKMEASKTNSKLEYLPDFDVSYRKKTMNNEANGSDVMLGFTVPLWFWKQNAGVKQASYELNAARSDKKNIELMIVSKAKETYLKLDAEKRLIDLYKDSIIPKSEQSLKVAQSQTSTGEMNYLEFLDISKAYLEFNLEYYELVSQYHENLSMLESITGTELYSGGTK